MRMFPFLSSVAAVACGLGMSAGQSPAAAATPSKPNIVLILADDMGYGDIGPFGSTVNRTPSLDRMAREGMKLTSFYACPVCTPSRAQFMTGCYAKRVSLPSVIFPACPIGLNAAEATLPKLLKQQGYATLCVGKWHLGDQREFLPTRHGFDHYFGLPYSNDMGGGEEGPKPKAKTAAGAGGAAAADTAPTELGVVRGRRPPLPLVRDLEVIETVSPAQQDKLTARYTDEAVKFMREHKDEPFFLYLPHTAVHVPLHPGEEFRGKSANGTYGDWVEEVDWSVGRVLDTLRELKLDDRTLVIFTSDNGPWLTQGRNGGVAGPLRGGKGSTWEGGVREPTIAWWPGKIAPGTSCDAVAANLDLLPTFVKLAGGSVPNDRKIDGADIWPLLSGAAQQSPREAHYYFNGNRLEAVRSGPWKLAIHAQAEAKRGEKPAKPPAAKAQAPRLYNLVDDIGESTDVAAKHPEVVKRLQELVAKMDADLGATGLGPGVRAPGRVNQPQPLLLPGAKLAPEAPAAAAPKRPNILLVHCHDLGQFLHCYGVKTVQTPHLDTLSAQGVRFSRSFCTAPGCSSSRSSLFTGRYPHSNGVMGLCHANFAWDLNPEERHLAQILGEAGYATAAVGVIHETSSGFKRCGYEVHIRQASAAPATDAAIKLLREFREQPGKPFFLSVGFIEPHRLAYREPSWPGALPGDNSFPGPALEPDNTLGVDIPGFLRETEGTRRELAGLQGAVRHVDTQVGRLMAALKDSGQEPDTLVIFTTDHGIAMPRAKASLYEPGVQVSLLLRLPGRKGWHGGIVRPEMVSNIDCLPTLLELLGLPIPASVQGRSFAPLLDGTAYQPRKEIFTELTYHDYYDPRRAIRTETHKLIVNFSTAPAFMDPSQCWRPSSDTVVPANHAVAYHPDVELYDLAKDPWEQTDVAGRPEYAAVRSELLKRLHQHLVETKDPILQGAVPGPQHRRAVELLEGQR